MHLVFISFLVKNIILLFCLLQVISFLLFLQTINNVKKK
jgi:hypothetical protein